MQRKHISRIAASKVSKSDKARHRRRRDNAMLEGLETRRLFYCANLESPGRQRGVGPHQRKLDRYRY